MRKLFLILSAAGLTATASSLVVACSQDVERWDQIKFDDQTIYKNLIIKMSEYGLITSSQADVFYDNESDWVTDITKLLNKMITDLEYESNDESLKNLFKINSDKSQETATDQILDNLAITKVYNDYTSEMISNNGKSKGDFTFGGGRTLNPHSLINGDDEYQYAIYFKEKDATDYLRWQERYEFDSEKKNVQTPSLELLSDNTEQNKNFIVVGSKNIDQQSLTQADVNSLSKIKIDDESSISDNLTSFMIDDTFDGFEIMKYRFQNKINSDVKPTLYDQLIGMAYLNSSLLSMNASNYNYTKNSARLNTTNKLVTSFQNRLNESQESNIKMVWSIQYKTATPEDVATWINKLQNAVGNTTSDGNINITGNSLTEIVKPLLNGTNNPSTDFTNDVQSGYDNFFGIKGYNGIIRDTDGGVESLTSETLSISSDAQTAISEINSPTILTNNGAGYSTSDGNATELVLVLPLYLNDIYSYHNINITKENANDTITIPNNTWITLSDKAFNYEQITSATAGTNTTIATDNQGKLYLKLNDGAATGQVTINNRAVIVNQETELSTLGVEGIVDKTNQTFTSAFSEAEQAKFADNDHILQQVNFTRTTDPVRNYTQMTSWEVNPNQSLDVRNLSAEAKQTLLDQIANGLIAKDTTYVDEAKTVLYTKYIVTGDVVLYQALYDQISQYIKEEDDDESD